MSLAIYHKHLRCVTQLYQFLQLQLCHFLFNLTCTQSYSGCSTRGTTTVLGCPLTKHLIVLPIISHLLILC